MQRIPDCSLGSFIRDSSVTELANRVETTAHQNSYLRASGLQNSHSWRAGTRNKKFAVFKTLKVYFEPS